MSLIFLNNFIYKKIFFNFTKCMHGAKFYFVIKIKDINKTLSLVYALI